MKNIIKETVKDVRENFARVFNFIYCALIVLGAYFVFMFLLNMFAHDLFVPDKDGETFFSFLGEYSWWIIYALAYGIPLYYVHFRKDGGLKTFVIHLTDKEFNKKELLVEFTKKYLKTDLILYAIYSALLLLPFKDVFDNPAGYIAIHQLLYYMLPMPRILGYICAIAVFTLQYSACFIFTERYFIKNRIRKK